MNINSIAPPSFSSISQLSQKNSVQAGTEKTGGDSFGSLVSDTLKSFENTQKSAEQEISKAVTGESPDLHKTIIALQSSELNFQFGLQVRNKLIGAYEEIMRMQV